MKKWKLYFDRALVVARRRRSVQLHPNASRKATRLRSRSSHRCPGHGRRSAVRSPPHSPHLGAFEKLFDGNKLQIQI